MKLFLQQCIVFVLGIMAINIFLFSQIAPRYYDPYEKRQIVDSCHTFILADSHGLPLDNAELLRNGIYNFSDASDSYFDLYRKLLFLIEHHKLKRIIVTVDNHTLSAYRENSNNLDRSLYFIDQVREDDVIQTTGALYSQKANKYLPLLDSKARDVFKTYLFSFTRRTKADTTTWANNINRQAIAKKRADEQFATDLVSTSLTNSLRAIIELCKENEIQLLGIKFPVSPDYIQATKGMNYGADQFMLSAGNEIVDFTNFTRDNQYFYDQDHLSTEGGQLFTKKLVTTLSTVTP